MLPKPDQCSLAWQVMEQLNSVTVVS